MILGPCARAEGIVEPLPKNPGGFLSPGDMLLGALVVVTVLADYDVERHVSIIEQGPKTSDVFLGYGIGHGHGDLAAA